ncbi:unnamed protein product [Caenorhabditis angaria]|uniref:Fukutin n=1 Tax=Caenorhabditis angaria TaxID=860376 RepID=A0A9P1IPN4_9PELO|nr:unnamed protein product [Caenorhabditis angaria]
MVQILSKKFSKISVFPIFCLIIYLFIYLVVKKENEKCLKLENIGDEYFGFPVLLLDKNILLGKCVEKVDVGVDIKYRKFVSFNSNSKFNFIFYINKTKHDYLTLLTEENQRIIPKKFETRNIEDFQVPVNIPLFFGFLERSTYIDCLGLKRNSPKNATKIRDFINSMVELRDLFINDFGIFFYLSGGTLLGWYRECSIIPHTEDVDLFVKIEDLNFDMTLFFKSGKTRFDFVRKLGRVNDSLTLTIFDIKTKTPIDIWFLYESFHENGEKYSWCGINNKQGQKHRFFYPLQKSWCATDLYGKIFWVPCSPKDILIADYGEMWYKDIPEKNYVWFENAKNSKVVGFFREDEMKDVYEWNPKYISKGSINK